MVHSFEPVTSRQHVTPPVPSPDSSASLPVPVSDPTGELPPPTVAKIVSKVKGDRILINDNYEVLLSHPIGELEHAFAEVYDVAQKDNRNQACLAYVIKDHYPARLEIVKTLLNRDIVGLMAIKSYGVTEWVDHTQRLILIFSKPQGPALLTQNVPKRPALSEDLIRRAIIKPICNGLLTMSQHGFTHGNVRADNVFWHAGDNNDAMIGECVTSLPGALQPVLYETIERGMADPLARGECTSSDDVYALGVLVAVLMRGQDPMAGKTDRFILEEKINRSTFMVMTDGLQLTPRMSDFFRATLSDDPRMRWTVEQVDNWLNGNRAPLKQYAYGKKATRALDFNGNKYLRARLIARDLYDNQSEAVQLIESGNLVKWLDRSLIDQNMIVAVQDAINRASYNGKNGSYEDRLICFVSMALDPAAPVRYKNIRAMPHGLGGLLLHTIMKGQNVQSIAEVIREKIAWFWLNNNDQPILDASDWHKRFDQLSKVILRRNMDYGLERCLYDMAPHAPCLGPTVKDFYILDGDQLLQALNSLGLKKDQPQNMIDRHIAAFVSSRGTKDNSNLINMLESEDPRKRAMSMLLLLQNLQRRHQVSNLPGLTAWLLKDAELLAQRFHNLKFRRDVVKALNNETKGGNITRLLFIVDNPQDVARDRIGYGRAIQLYKELEIEHAQISNQLKTNKLFGRDTGRQIAAIISAILAAVFIVGSVMMRYTLNGDM